MSDYVITFEDGGSVREGRDLGTFLINEQDARYFGIQMGLPGSVTRQTAGMPREFACVMDGRVRLDDSIYPEGRRPDGTTAVLASVRVSVEGMDDEDHARRIGIDDGLLNRMAALLGPDLDLHGEWVVADIEEEAPAPTP